MVVDQAVTKNTVEDWCMTEFSELFTNLDTIFLRKIMYNYIIDMSKS